MEALRKAEARLTVHVHPSNVGDVRGAVSRQLSTLLFTYEERFDGVLLAHEFQFVDQKDGAKDRIQAKILNGLVPYIGVPVHATLLLFSPQPGMMLEGRVEMLGRESVHAIVLGVFSVAIMAKHILRNFKFRRHDGEARFISRSDNQHVIQEGSMIRFLVKRVDTEMNCHMTGSLTAPHTGCMKWLAENDYAYASEMNRYAAENSSKKRRSRDIGIRVVKYEQEEHGRLDEKKGFTDRDRPRKVRKRSSEER